MFLILSTVIILLLILNNLYFYNIIAPSLPLAISVATLYGCALMYILFAQPVFFFLTVLFSFFQYTSILSNVYLESGAYISEVQMDTFASGSTLRLVTIDFAFLYFAFIVYTFFIRRFQRFKAFDMEEKSLSLLNQEKFILSIIGFIVVMFFINGLIYSFPLFNLEQRFDYWGNHPFGSLGSKLFYLLSYMPVALAYYFIKYSFNRNLKKKIIVISVTSVVLAILYSNKFSWLSNFIFMWMIGYISAKYELNEKVPLVNIIKKLLLLFPFLALLVVFSYVYVHGYKDSDLVNMITSRIFALQGQMWWAIDDYVLANDASYDIRHIFTKYEGRPSGIFLLMEQVTPTATFDYFYNKMIPFTMAYPAITLYSIGYVGSIVVQLFFSAYWMFISMSLFSALYNKNMIRFLLSIFLFASMQWAMVLGSTHVLFVPLNLIILFFLLIEYIFSFVHKSKKSIK